MNMNETIKLVAQYLGLDERELSDYAAEDIIGGYSARGESPWKIGSIYAEEGVVLYALCRMLKPAHVVEIGSLWGCSSAHIATALDINDFGQLTSIDVNDNAGQDRPAHLKKYITQIIADGRDWLASQPDNSIQLLFEDSSHGTDMCEVISILAQTKLAPGGVFLTHDASHDYAILEDGRQIPSNVGYEIRIGLDRGLGEGTYQVYKTEPSDCGFAIWQKPHETITTPDGAVLMVENAPPVEQLEKPKRKPGRKSKTGV